jgi:hypothetical protein
MDGSILILILGTIVSLHDDNLPFVSYHTVV